MSKSWKYILPMLAGIAVLAFMVPMSASAADTIKVGIVLPVTGPQAKFGEIEKQSLGSFVFVPLKGKYGY